MMASVGDNNTLLRIVIATSIISIVSTGLLFASFCAFKRLRTPSNILIFYASIANFIVNFACLGATGLRTNPDEPSCQAQAFLVQWLMQADPWWSSAMAFNLYLCVCRGYTIGELKRLYWVYVVVCYGVPLVPALFCLFYHDGRGKIYGNSVLWCWIKIEYVDIRIWSTYLPIWSSILITLAIYSRIGFVIFKLHNDMKSIYKRNPTSTGSEATMIESGPHDIVPPLSPTSDLFKQPYQVDELPQADTTTSKTSGYRTLRFDSIDALIISHAATSSKFRETFPDKEWGVGGSTALNVPVVAKQVISSSSTPALTQLPQTHAPNVRSSTVPLVPLSSQQSINRLRWAYAKPALLFSCSILITWIPPTINRAQSLKSPGIPPSFPLLVVQSIVLPLQGFWNSLIYFVISWSVVKNIWREWREK